MAQTLEAIEKEQARQEEKWGIQRHAPALWMTILAEEFGEVARAILEDEPQEHLIEELIQVAAVCATWVDSLEEEDQ